MNVMRIKEQCNGPKITDNINIARTTGRSYKQRKKVYRVLAISLLEYSYVQSKKPSDSNLYLMFDQ